MPKRLTDALVRSSFRSNNPSPIGRGVGVSVRSARTCRTPIFGRKNSTLPIRRGDGCEVREDSGN